MKLYSHSSSLSLSTNESEDHSLVEMNTTPLIDVMLVLLVMLIITIPAQLHSYSLDMPSIQTSKLEPEIVIVQMDASGLLHWGSEGIPDSAVLNARVMAAAALSVQPEIHLHPSPNTPYALVAGFLIMTEKAGLQKVGVVN